MSVWASRFGLLVRIGVVANLVLAMLGLLAPDLLLSLLRLPLARPDIWLRFAAWLLILLSLFYLPPASDPYRSRSASMLVVAARFAGVVFFSSVFLLLDPAPTYLVLAGFDLAFGLPQAYCLRRALADAEAVGPGP